MKIYNKSVEGASHKESGNPCQDYSISQSFDKGSIVVVSDGHGSKTYVRSDVGSKLACKIAVEETTRFIFDNYEVLKKKGVTPLAYTPDGGSAPDTLFTSLFTNIHNRWYDAIKEDSLNKTFTDEEKSKLGNADIKKAYGCTLIVAVKTTDFTFAYQIGDGRLFAVAPYNIRKWEQPVPWDSLCEDNVTTSLCNVHPIERFRYYLNSGNNQPFALFVCSDGIEDCFDGEHNSMFTSEKLQVEYSEILCRFLSDDNFDKFCEDFLIKESIHGSKDDMSIAFIIDDIYNIQERWIELNRLYRGAFIIKSRYDYYKKNIEDCKRRLTVIDKNIEQLNGAISDLDHKILIEEKSLDQLKSEKLELESRPNICDGFSELIGNLLDSIRIWCDQYNRNADKLTDKFHDSLKDKLISAINTVKCKIEEIKVQIPDKISELQDKIELVEKSQGQLCTKKEEYETDRKRHNKKRVEISDEINKNDVLRTDAKTEFDQYQIQNKERLSLLKETIRKSVEVEDATSSDNQYEEFDFIGRSWNIAKSPDEYIQINVYNNNVQLALTDLHGTNNHSISLESFKNLYAKITKLYSADICPFEPIDKYVTIITTDERGEMETIELGYDSATMIWDTCMELIKKQR